MSEATKDSKFCKDCKWSFMLYTPESKYDWYSSYCTHPKFIPEQQYDYVIGPVPIDYSSCYGLRASGECGPEGKYWESPIKGSERVKFEDLYWDAAPKPKVSWWNWIRGKVD